MFTVVFFILLHSQIHSSSNILFNPDSSSFILLRHLRLSTNDEYYRIRCPYNLNHLNLQLLNYSNDHCFNLYPISNHNACRTHYSPCQFQAKSIRLYCDDHSYSKSVDITYQCSYEHLKESFPSPMTRSHSTNQDETISLFLIGLGIVITIWIFVCCIWFICCHDEDDNDNDDDSQFVSSKSYSRNISNDLRKKISLNINPFENKQISIHMV